MNREDLFEAIGEIDGRSVRRAEKFRASGKPAWIRWAALAACIALLVGAFAVVPRLKKGGSAEETAVGENEVLSNESEENDAGSYDPELVAVLAKYPASVGKKMSPEDFMESGEYYGWRSAYREKKTASAFLQEDLNGYYAAIMEKLLVSDEENTVCSPLNTYIAFAMLAEVTGGNTRQQILDMLGAPDIETLRKNTSVLWEGNYAETPLLTSVLADSLWLRDGIQYNEETLNTLAEQYYASSFHGKPGSGKMDEALQTWTDENTGGLLSEYVKDMHLDPNTVLAVVSTIYYKAGWEGSFDSIGKETFHGVRGDTQVDMMHRIESMEYYSGDAFTAVGLPLSDSGTMYFCLPAEGTDVNALATDPELLRTLRHGSGGWTRTNVRLSAPKFRASAKTDLLETMSALGVTDALDPLVSDFTPLTEQTDQICISQAEHAAMVEIDQDGVKGAAYTMVMEVEAAVEEEPEEPVEFTVDRPFLFVITGADGSILFSGAVRNIE